MNRQINQMFSSLTPKQVEALDLACRHLTSKQIAQKLGINPASVDKRIDSVRAKLNGIPRSDLLNLYANWLSQGGENPPFRKESQVEKTTVKPPHPSYQQGENLTSGSIPLTHSPTTASEGFSQPDETTYTFEDSYAFSKHTSSQGWSFGPFPGMKPSDLGIVGKVICVLGGAVALLGIAILSIAFSQALMTMFGGH